jgi:6-phosphogluconate dehydrogenase
MSQDIGLIGLAVMGQNLALNMAEKGWGVSVYNRTASKIDEFLKQKDAVSIQGYAEIGRFVKSLKRPRKIIIMVKAGLPVDEVISQLLPYLEAGDIVLDGGNSYYKDSSRRQEELLKRGILFLGTGISGGEEGARRGPSIMPGGSFEAWKESKDILQSIAACVDKVFCCHYIGEGGSGHFVKMVHNGIEYADMQLIAESYDIMKRGLSISCEELAQIFSSWNQSFLSSYLIEITATIFQHKDKDGSFLVESILDVAGQKGTGKWTVESALDLSVPLTVIGEAVFARFVSSEYDLRQQASKVLKDDVSVIDEDKRSVVESLKKALYAAKIFCYAQGFALLKKASEDYEWRVHFGDIALMWRGGCIIRSAFLNKISEAYENNPELSLLILDAYFTDQIQQCIPDLRRIVSLATSSGIAIPCFSSSLAWYDSIRRGSLPTNLIQAQRDLFGSHMFERLDADRGKLFHESW